MTQAGIPEAWPALMSREQLCAYLGGICDATLRKVCPVPPVDLGANVLRYRRVEVDAWVNARPHRLLRAVENEQDAPSAAPVANDRPSSAVERARARAGGKR